MTKKYKSPATLKLLTLFKSLRPFATIAPLVFLFGGCYGYGWLVPYAAQPSYHKFKKVCELDPKIYQKRKGHLDDEYFARLLALADMDWDTMIQVKERNSLKNVDGDIVPNKFFYNFDNIAYSGRLSYHFEIRVTIENDEIIDRDAVLFATWKDMRGSFAWYYGWLFTEDTKELGCDDLANIQEE
ncbi:hypothetical protein BKN38_04890 [Helicobacter sp. CLO-3]|uniref:hypothetical protein n=1 Tax=unclassified Helicobacter TaxID=2593540 RepID=UPI00080551B5|nr:MULTISPECIES: hypothetical protein [unclassified Helicobacter]OBV28537.1 hypothetical protein BA723_09110 [Helicobacter sp. CLO-3]OHU83925.1 hypothetical protein BKN38_04890 [Helicobacter sp. CLO-3]